MNSKEVRSLMEAYASVYEGYKEKEEKGEKEEKDCVDKEDKGKHNCAKKVCHEQFGEGTCIFGEHAVPDENGFVSHYDVLFNHGVEKDVPVSEMEVLEEGSHNEDYHRYEGEQIAEMDIVGELRRGLEKIGVRGTSPALEKEKAADKESRRLGGNRMRQAEGDNTRPTPLKDDVDIFDIVKGYLIDEGATEEEVYDMMAHLTDEQRDAIVESPGEWFGGIRDKARVSRSAGAGGGAAAEAKGASIRDVRQGFTRAQVMQQRAKDLENKKRTQPVNQGPDFGR